MPPSANTGDSPEFLETRSVQLEWKVANLRAMFDATKGDVKSKCHKSPLFDQARWQVFLYPNSGHDQYVSLYLSCEPTQAEKERALSEKPEIAAQPGASTDNRVGKDGGKERDRLPWKRDGHFKFSFEARSIDRRVTFKSLEADEHHFTHKTRNWGYQSFWKRSEAFYNNPSTRSADAFLIICTITSAPCLPTSPPLPHMLVPKTLLSAYASMFDDPDYSDVVFRIKPDAETGAHGSPRRAGREKRLYAAKKVLAGRSEYFDTMFSSGFNESTFTVGRYAGSSRAPANVEAMRELEDEGELENNLESSEDEGESNPGWDEDDNSGDGEEDEDEEAEDEETEGAGPVLDRDDLGPGLAASRQDQHTSQPVSPTLASPDGADQSHSPVQERRRPWLEAPAHSRTSSAALSDDERAPDTTSRPITPSAQRQGTERTGRSERAAEAGPEYAARDESDAMSSRSRYVDARSVPPSPIKPTGSARSRVPKTSGRQRVRDRRNDGRPRFEVVVTDAAYSTFRGLLHYLYTDSIQFAPLASSYYAARDLAASTDQPFPWPSRRAFLLAHHSPHQAGAAAAAAGTGLQSVGPCSAKAIYRLADKMGLAELKERAYEHIVQSLTPQNIVYEVFGSFSMRFDEVRRVEVAYLLEKWNEVRSSAQMRTVFDYLRTSRFPGFEEVWFEIMQNLEVKIPPALPPATSTAAPVYATGRPDTGGGSAGDAAVAPGVRVATGHGEA